MSLASNRSGVAFSSNDNIDKIVDVFEGSFNKATQTTTRTDGFSSTIYVYGFSHGFTRPVLAHLLWSEDNSTWVDGGNISSGGNGAIAFSDSDNLYIGSTSNSGTLYYKIIATWIHDYDSTNPSVGAFTDAPTKALFDSRNNYQKIYLEDDTTYSAGTFGSQQTVSITHNLGYKPNAKAWFESISGEVWPLHAGGVSNVFNYSITQDEAVLKIYTDRIDIVVTRFSNAARRIWYKVYYDG